MRLTPVKIFCNLYVHLNIVMILIASGLLRGCTLTEGIKPKSRGITGTKLEQSFTGEWDLLIDVQIPNRQR